MKVHTQTHITVSFKYVCEKNILRAACSMKFSLHIVTHNVVNSIVSSCYGNLSFEVRFLNVDKLKLDYSMVTILVHS